MAATGITFSTVSQWRVNEIIERKEVPDINLNRLEGHNRTVTGTLSGERSLLSRADAGFQSLEADKTRLSMRFPQW